MTPNSAVSHELVSVSILKLFGAMKAELWDKEAG